MLRWRGAFTDLPRIQSPIGTRPALSAGLPSITSKTCHTFSQADSGSQILMLRPRRDGCASLPLARWSLCCKDHVREGMIDTTSRRCQCDVNIKGPIYLAFVDFCYSKPQGWERNPHEIPLFSLIPMRWWHYRRRMNLLRSRRRNQKKAQYWFGRLGIAE